MSKRVEFVLKILEGLPFLLDQERRKGFTTSDIEHFIGGYLSALIDYLRIHCDDDEV